MINLNNDNFAINLLFLSSCCLNPINDELSCTTLKQGEQRRMVLAVILFRIFENQFFCFVVAIFDLVHAVVAIFPLP